MGIAAFRGQGSDVGISNFLENNTGNTGTLYDIAVGGGFIWFARQQHIERYDGSQFVTLSAPAFGEKAIVFSSGRLIMSIQGSGIWTSDDFGENWTQRVSDGLLINVAADGAGQVFAPRFSGTTTQFSTDNGTTFNSQTGGASGITQSGFTVQPGSLQFLNGEFHYFANNNRYFVTDDVQNWNEFTYQFNASNIGQVNSLVFARGQFYWAANNGNLYAPNGTINPGSPPIIDLDILSDTYYNQNRSPAQFQAQDIIEFNERLYAFHNSSGIQYDQGDEVFVPAGVGGTTSLNAQFRRAAVFNDEVWTIIGSDIFKTLSGA